MIPDNKFDLLFHRPINYRHITLEEFLTQVRQSKMHADLIERNVTLLGHEIKAILADEIDHCSYLLYLDDYIIHVYIDCLHTYDMEGFYDEVEWEIKVYPKNPEIIQSKSRDEVIELFDQVHFPNMEKRASN